MSFPVLKYAHSIAIALFLCNFTVYADDNEISAEQEEFFEAKVRPLLVDKCYGCHSTESGTAEGKLLLDSRPAMKRGGTRGTVMELGAGWQASLMWQAISYETDLQMPPDGRLSDEHLATLKQWLEMGGPDPRRTETSDVSKQLARPDYSTHWAYQPLQRSELERQVQDNWSRDRIDEIVFARLAAKGIQPNATASDEVLVKRLAYDLTGLPATKAEIESYIADQSSDKYEKLVDSLLSSDAFAERFARHWMDVVRYADTKGYVFQEDRQYPEAYRYRDWLIKAFKEDMPYNEFVRYQIAADKLDPENKQGHQSAMGMLTLGRRFLNNPHDIADDRIDVVSRGLMALSVACARCHDHKYDPVSMADYYSLHSVFVNSEELKKEEAPLALTDKADISPAFIFKRGMAGNRGDQVDKNFVKFISLTKEYPLSSGSGRIDLADALVDPANPLTPRTIVNRMWGWVTNKPIVATPSDFGVRCPEPLYRDMLDELSIDFTQDNWSMKRLIRRIVMSSTYRMTSDYREDAASIDAANDLLWRTERRRKDFEALRDSMLAVTQQLNREVGGKSVNLFENPFPRRRTMYGHIDRQNLPNVYRAFDFANPDTHVPMRSATTVPQQGLFLLNSDLVMNMAEEFASQLTENSGDETQTDHIRRAFHAILLRDPTSTELDRAIDFVRATTVELPVRTEDAWSYGWGGWDGESRQLISFNRYENFGDQRWRVSDQVPDPNVGWCFLTNNGGHPDMPKERATIRRWTAPRDGTVHVHGHLKHPAEAGDGISVFICKDKQPISQVWSAKQSELDFAVRDIALQAGANIDLVVDSNTNQNSDGFEMRIWITYEGGRINEFDSQLQFVGPPPQPTTPTQQLVHALLISNEFAFVD